MIDMHPEVRITRLRHDDARGLEYLVQLLCMLHAETPHAPLCVPKLRRHAQQVTRDGYVFVSVTPDMQMAGTVALEVDQPFFSEQDWLVDRWMFVHPACRRTPHAKMLLRAAKLTARDLKMPLQMTVTGFGSARTAGKIRLFSRELGEANGAVWNVHPELEAA